MRDDASNNISMKASESGVIRGIQIPPQHNDTAPWVFVPLFTNNQQSIRLRPDKLPHNNNRVTPADTNSVFLKQQKKYDANANSVNSGVV